MSSNIQNIKIALEKQLNTASAPLPTAWENVAFTPPTDGGAYQLASFMPADPVNPVMGDAMHREIGMMQVTLSYALNGGSGRVYAKADTLRDLFPRGTTLSSGGVTVMISSTPSIGPGRVQDDRYTLPIRVRYFANVFG